MKNWKAVGLAVSLSSLISAVAWCEDAAQPPAAAPSPSAPAAEAPKEEPNPFISAPAKAEEAAPAKAADAAPAKVEEAPAKAADAAPVAKPLDSCAAKLQPIADAYQQAHDNFVTWLRSASDKMDASAKKIADLKAQIADKESAITKAKLESGPAAEAAVKDLDAADKALWGQLKAEQARRETLCRALASAGKQKVREFNATVVEAAGKIAP